MAEGAGLENRYTGNGIVGSNPTLSAPEGVGPARKKDPLIHVLLAPLSASLSQLPGPDDCLLIGFCRSNPDQGGPPPGLLYLALGLVALGIGGLWQEWRGTRQARIGRTAA